MISKQIVLKQVENEMNDLIKEIETNKQHHKSGLKFVVYEYDNIINRLLSCKNNFINKDFVDNKDIFDKVFFELDYCVSHLDNLKDIVKSLYLFKENENEDKEQLEILKVNFELLNNNKENKNKVILEEKKND